MSNEITTFEPGNEATHFDLMQRKAKLLSMSLLVPEHLRKGTPEQALANCYIGLQMADAMREHAVVILQNIHVINGKAGFSSQYMIARANASGIFEGRIGWRMSGKGRDLAATAYAKLKDTGQEISVDVDMAMAEAEGWTKNPKYKSMPEVMLRYRSAAFLVRFYCPEVMLGYQTSEELEDVSASAGYAPQLAESAKTLTASAIIQQAEANDTAQDTPFEDVAAETHDTETGEIITEGGDPASSDDARAEAKRSAEALGYDDGWKGKPHSPDQYKYADEKTAYSKGYQAGEKARKKEGVAAE